jgi:hypothetical protein
MVLRGCRISSQRKGTPVQVQSRNWCVSDPRKLPTGAPAVAKIELPVSCNMTQNYSDDSAAVQPHTGNQTPSSKTNCSAGQNNLEDLWTWSINGSKIDGSLSFLTGAVKVVQKVLSYWRDEVLTWWDRFRNRCSRWTSGVESSEEEGETSDEGDDAETTDEDI